MMKELDEKADHEDHYNEDISNRYASHEDIDNEVIGDRRAGMIKENDLVLGMGRYYDMDSYKTRLNNNVLVAGASGSGKTRNIVIPNILQAVGSYVISDPKGNLYRKYGDYLRKKGYRVRKLNFVHPEESIGYNPLEYADSEQDIIKLAKIIVRTSTPKGSKAHGNDPFWDQAAEVLFTSLIALAKEMLPPCQKNLTSVLKMIAEADIDEYSSSNESVLDRLVEGHAQDHPDSFGVRQYK